MSLSRTLAEHINDGAWLEDAFRKLAQGWMHLDRNQIDVWVRKHITGPRHRGGHDKNRLREIKQMSRKAWHEMRNPLDR
jgi:hypothetical protein